MHLHSVLFWIFTVVSVLFQGWPVKGCIEFFIVKHLLHRAATHWKPSPNQYWGVNRCNCEEQMCFWKPQCACWGHYSSLVCVRNSQTRATKLIGTLRSSPASFPLRTELYGFKQNQHKNNAFWSCLAFSPPSHQTEAYLKQMNTEENQKCSLPCSRATVFRRENL